MDPERAIFAPTERLLAALLGSSEWGTKTLLWGASVVLCLSRRSLRGARFCGLQSSLEPAACVLCC
jgi:hypothetical protein